MQVRGCATHCLPNWNNGSQEFHHLDSVIPRCEEKVQPLLSLLDVECILIGPVLEDQLLQIQEGPFMRNLLAHLHHSFPRVLCSKFRAVGALAVQNHILDLEYLL